MYLVSVIPAKVIDWSLEGGLTVAHYTFMNDL